MVMHSAIKPEAPRGLRVQEYKASKGAKLVDGRSAIARNNSVELRDAKGVVLVREDMGSHENAKRVAKEWVA